METQYQRFSEIEEALQKGEKEVMVKIAHNERFYSRDVTEMIFQKHLPTRKVKVNGYGSKYYVHVN